MSPRNPDGSSTAAYVHATIWALPSLVFGTREEFARHLSSTGLAHRHYHSKLLKGRCGVLMCE